MNSSLTAFLSLFLPFFCLAFNESSPRPSMDQPSMTIEQIELVYEKFKANSLTPEQFIYSIEILQIENIWNINHLYFMKDLFENELFNSESPQKSKVFLTKYCKILLLFREEFSDSYAQYFDRCPYGRINLKSLQRKQDIKIEGYFFSWDTSLNGEYLDTPHIIQFTDSRKSVKTLKEPISYVYELNSKRADPYREHSAFEKLVERINEAPPNLYEKNKLLIWTTLSVFIGAMIIQRNYEISF